ncbi:hypothetical protein PG1C_08365 [Rugosibacter aromaticivorans]|uniref:Uncharacterized protein n=1 Tax=Rugosibacter aromaticivorans TaxID=1565605 RepID=A0A0C5J909_9PROT|nr:hypothetical protein PG1C_08365 [Rugosibacter aromaticivorans]
MCPVKARRQADIDELLRIEHEIGTGFFQRLFARAQGREHLQRGDNTVAGGVPVKTDDVARIFAAEHPAVLLHHLQHITVTHLGAAERDVKARECVLKAQVAHQGSANAAYRRRMHTVPRDEIQQTVTIVNFTRRIHHHQTVAVAIQRNTAIGF